MATNQPGSGDSLDTIIRTVFTTEGDAKTEAAIKRIQQRQNQYYADINKRAKETVTATQLINRAFLDLDRQNALENIRRDFIAAAKSGENFKDSLKKLRAELEQVGATQREVNQIVREGAQAAGGGGPGRGQALKEFGREARLSVPAFPIPGTGISTEFLFRVTEVAGRLNLSLKDLAIGGAVAVGAMIAIGVALKNFEAVTKPIIDQFNAIRRARTDVAGLLATGSAQDIVQAREDALKALTEAEAERTQAIQDAAAQFSQARGQGVLGQLLVGLSNIGAGPLATMNQDISKLDEALASAKTTLDALNPEYQRYVDQLEAERIQRMQEGFLDTVRGAEMSALQGTSDALDDRIEALRLENELIERDLNTYVLSAEKQDQYNQQIERNNIIIERLNGAVREQVEATEAAAKAEEYLKDQRKEIATLTEKMQADLERVEQDAAARRVELTQRFNDRMVDIAQKAADAADDAVRKLEQKRADLASDLGNDLTDAEVEHAQAQLDARLELLREDAKAAREHADRIREIERKSRASSRQAIQDRDAIALQAAEDQLTDDIQSENERFEAGRRERNIAYREELQDQETQFAREREQRYAKYQRDLEEAQLQFNREAEQQAINRARQERDLALQNANEIAALNQKHAQQKQIIQSAYSAELAVVSLGQAARLQLEAQHQQALINLAARYQLAPQAPTTGYGGSITPFARGGDIKAGQTGLVNDLNRFQRESFTDRRGRTIPLPEGMGYFTPTQSGRINPNGGGSTINLNVEGATVRTMQITSRDQAMQVFNEALDQAGVT